MYQLEPPNPPFLSLDQKTYFTNIFLFILVHPHDKFQNNPVFFFYRSRIFPKMGQLGSPEPPFFSLDKKKLPNFWFLNQKVSSSN